MSAPQFTPAPWEAHSGYLVRKCEDGFCVPIAEIRAPYRKGVGLVRGNKEEWHNIHLIAAAPELYELICAAIMEHDAGGVSLATIGQMREVAAKARGEGSPS